MKILEKIQQALTEDRLLAYGQDGADLQLVLARYLWNLAICESLYTPLQLAEVSLRNSINLNLTEQFGKRDWYEDIYLLTSWQNDQLTLAKQKMKKNGKSITTGEIITELSLGFWTGFFNKVHVRSGLGHSLAAHVFPYAPRCEKDLRKIDYRWKRIRDLRNRVFHHERIIHWKDLDLQYEAIIEVIGWISPEMHLMSERLGRFKSIRSQGLGPWVEIVRQISENHIRNDLSS